MRQFFAVGEFCVRTSVEPDFPLDNKQKKRLSRMLPTLPTTGPLVFPIICRALIEIGNLGTPPLERLI